MADGEYSDVHAMQPARPFTVLNRSAAESKLAELRERDNAVLPGREGGQPLIAGRPPPWMSWGIRVMPEVIHPRKVADENATRARKGSQ